MLMLSHLSQIVSLMSLLSPIPPIPPIPPISPLLPIPPIGPSAVPLPHATPLIRRAHPHRRNRPIRPSNLGWWASLIAAALPHVPLGLTPAPDTTTAPLKGRLVSGAAGSVAGDVAGVPRSAPTPYSGPPVPLRVIPLARHGILTALPTRQPYQLTPRDLC
jgi:hypothetical protein